MCDDDIHPGLVEDSRLSRRGFGLLTVAGASLAAAPALAQSNVVEKDVAVKTPDGTSDCALFYPTGTGAWPAVLIWPDIMGLRPAFRDMGRRLAGEGYVVLVVNPFYRSAKAPVIDDKFDFSNPEQRARLTGYRAAIGDDGADRDSVAYLDVFSTRSPRPTRTRKRVCRAIAWAVRCPSARRRRCQAASRRWAASMAAGW
jgi:carboxymethylenebutenolidase